MGIGKYIYSWFFGSSGDSHMQTASGNQPEPSSKEKTDQQNGNQPEPSSKETTVQEKSALQQKEEEPKSSKEKLAAEVDVSLKTEDTESMNNPVSKTRLYEMYHKLRLLQWPKVKDLMKSTKINPEVLKTLVQKMFKDAAEEMERRKKLIEATFGVVIEVTESSELTPQKVKKCKQLVIQKHQLSLYHNSRKDLKKTLFFELDTQYSQDVVVKLRSLASECYWLSCLLALNNPPLQPDWENKVKGMDPWEIFPQEINIFSDM